MEVAAGYNHSLMLKQNGKVYAFGENSFGQCDIPKGLQGKVYRVKAYMNTTLLLSINSLWWISGNYDTMGEIVD